jgi:hypothetical protein
VENTLLYTILLNIAIYHSFQNSCSWSAGWSSIVPLTLDCQPHILGYKNEDGTVAIDKINAGGEGEGITEVWCGPRGSNIVN